jgi:hypothetical protein
MSDRQHPWRIRVAFEPNRFGAEHLVRVYEQIEPVKSQIIERQPSGKRTTSKHAVANGRDL